LTIIGNSTKQTASEKTINDESGLLIGGYQGYQKEIEMLEKKFQYKKEELTYFRDLYKKLENISSPCRNVLLIGRTGNGKSTLGNVLINKNNRFEEVFKESSGGISKTRAKQSEVFEYEGTNYRIIDTIGIGDTKLKD